MAELHSAFQERLSEIESYLDLLEGIEGEAQSGPPRFGQAGPLITPVQQRILYSGVFLLLYNLVESTIVRCLDGVTDAAMNAGNYSAGDLKKELRQEWIRVMARTHADLNFENRLKHTVDLCDHLVSTLRIAGFKVDRGGGGNWDDETIERITKRIGFNLHIDTHVYQAVKRQFRDELGPLGLVKKLRNSLAHGLISFSECGENITVNELRDLASRIASYLGEVVNAFESYISDFEFLLPEKRPT